MVVIRSTIGLICMLLVLLRKFFKLLFDEGLGYSFRYCFAVLYLSVRQAFKASRFEFYDTSADGDPEKIGMVPPKHEWDYECPRQAEELAKFTDDVFIYGVNSSGESLVLWLSRLKNQVAQVWLQLRTADGTVYHLPHSFSLDLSDANCFASLGLKVQCVSPMRIWRIAYNGLLRKTNNLQDGKSSETVHVRFGFMWYPTSGVFDNTTNYDAYLLAESFAQLSFTNMLLEMDKFPSVDSYEQAGQMNGEIFVGDDRYEFHLWGGRIRNKGGRYFKRLTEDHYFGFLEDGTVYHLVHTDDYGPEDGLYYGNVFQPDTYIRPITECMVRSDDEKRKHMRVYITAGKRDYPISLNHVHNSEFSNEDSEKTFSVSYAKLKSEVHTGHGFTIRVSSYGQASYRIPEYFRHQAVPDSTDDKERVVNIEESVSKNPNLTGGKGSSLAVLSSISRATETFSVPKAVVVTTSAYKEFQTNHDFQKAVRKLANATSSQDSKTIKEYCKFVTNQIENLALGETLKKEIEKKLTKVFGSDVHYKTFAVRSSAVGEDSEEMSAAGQMTTYLGVRSLNKILQSVVKCWASQFSFTAVNYKRQYGQCLDYPMAVVIQEMAPADVAGVMFTCDPVKGNPSFITITANYGLGESVVAASAEPDTIVLKRVENLKPTIESVTVGTKALQVSESEVEGVVMLTVDEDKAKSCCMDYELAIKLAQVGIEIEKCYTTPRDLEWAVVSGKIVLLQCRPVTSIFKESDYETIHELDSAFPTEKELLTKCTVAEILPGAVSQLGRSFLCCAFDLLSKDHVKGSQVGYDYDDNLYSHSVMPMAKMNAFLSMSQSDFNMGEDSLMGRSLMYSMIGRDISGSEYVSKSARRIRTRKFYGPFVQLKNFLKAYWNLNKTLKRVTELSISYHVPVEGLFSAAQMYRTLGASLSGMRPAACGLMDGFMNSSLFNLGIINLLSKASGEMNEALFSDFSKIISSGSDIESVDVPNSIQNLARILSKSRHRDDFVQMTPEDAVRWLQSSDDECGEKFREFLEKHGHRCVKEFDVYTLPWGLNAVTLIKSLQLAAKQPAADSKIKTKVNLDELAIKLTPFQKFVLKFVMTRAWSAVAAREIAKSAIVRCFHKVRLAVRRLSEQMVREGRLPSEELIYFFTFDEIGRLLKTRSPALMSKALRRQRLFAHLDKLKFPSLSVGIPKEIVPKEANYSSGGVEMKGVPVSLGIARGPAKVIHYFDEAEMLQKGDILITNATDTGWTPYFPLLAGVVTEVGGLLSHGAVVAREYGLPCVVGVDGATAQFMSGDFVEVNGTQGYIRRIVLSSKDEEPNSTSEK